MDGARYVLLWPEGIERFTDQRDRSERAWKLHAAGFVTAAWTERTLDVLVRLAGQGDDDDFPSFEWELGSTTADVVAAYPNAVAYRFPDLDGDYSNPWLSVGAQR